MKRLLLSMALLFVAGTVAFGAVSGTAHDLRGTIGGSQICVPCHTPHGGTPDVPLWNHAAQAGGYTPYTSTTIDADDANAGDPQAGSISFLCLSCHDGSIALGSVINDPGDLTDTTTTMGAVIANLGTDLANDHPVAFAYDNQVFTDDGGLVDPSTITTVTFFGGGNDMECATCHDVHDNTNAPFLVMSNAASALCTTCHVK